MGQIQEIKIDSFEIKDKVQEYDPSKNELENQTKFNKTAKEFIHNDETGDLIAKSSNEYRKKREAKQSSKESDIASQISLNATASTVSEGDFKMLSEKENWSADDDELLLQMALKYGLD